MLWVAAAGPASNVVQALAWALTAKLLFNVQGAVATYWVQVAEAGILVNLILAILNLFPILPLDGGRILASLLPSRMSHAYQGTERYGMIILIVLIVTGLLGWLLRPLLAIGVSAIYALFALG
jgi:Zn-dependent protease